MASKANGRQAAKNAAHYKAQYMVTFNNKLKRVLKSSGKHAASMYRTLFFEVALKNASKNRTEQKQKGSKT